MNGLGILIIPAGILAALVCFRSVRTLAMLALVVLMVWVLTLGAHAEGRTIVFCELGPIAREVPDYVCTALEDAYPLLKTHGEPDATQSVKWCAELLDRRIGPERSPQQFSQYCWNLLADTMRADAYNRATAPRSR